MVRSSAAVPLTTCYTTPAPRDTSDRPARSTVPSPIDWPVSYGGPRRSSRHLLPLPPSGTGSSSVDAPVREDARGGLERRAGGVSNLGVPRHLPTGIFRTAGGFVKVLL